MTTHIALFAAVNVGGTGKLPMKELAAVLENLGAKDVRTYIQSGNAVFRHKAADGAKLARQITAAIGKSHGFEPAVILLSRPAYEAIAAANPYPGAEADPKTLHVFFLAAPSPADPAALEKLRAPSEHFTLTGAALYLHAPEGIGKSRLAARAGKLLAVPQTARNWRTVTTLRDMAANA